LKVQWRKRIGASCAAALLVLGSLVTLLVGPAAAVPDGASRFVPFGPVRLVDSRVPGQRALLGPVGDNAVVTIQVTGQAGLPTSGISAVVVNLTLVNTSGPGFAQALPAGSAPGGSSNLNVLSAGQTMASMAVVPLGAGGRISVYEQRRADLIVDVLGYFTPSGATTAGRYLAVSPARLLDSRSGIGLGAAGRFERGGVRKLAVAGRGGVPANARAAVLNVTVTDPAGPGFVSVMPSGGALPPSTSTVNVERAGQTRANLAVVPLGPDGGVTVFSDMPAHVLADVTGYVTASSAARDTDGLFVPLSPSRLLDTRSGIGVPAGKPGAGAVLTVPAAGRGGIPTSGVAAVAAAITATDANGPGYVTAWPAGAAVPPTSALNTSVRGDTVPNAAFVGLGTSGGFSLFTSGGTHLLADVTGYFLGAATPPAPAAPAPSAASSESDRWAYWGYLYSDGKQLASGAWRWTQAPLYYGASAARFERGAALNGINVTRQSNGDYVTQTAHPALPDLRGRAPAEVAAYLAAVIEGEGDRCTGLVDDDPSRAHVEYLAQLLAQLGVSSRLESNNAGTYWELYAARASWPIIQSWPYATTARTPGIGC
jgi:hypothetical protein